MTQSNLSMGPHTMPPAAPQRPQRTVTLTVLFRETPLAAPEIPR